MSMFTLGDRTGLDWTSTQTILRFYEQESQRGAEQPWGKWRTPLLEETSKSREEEVFLGAKVGNQNPSVLEHTGYR